MTSLETLNIKYEGLTPRKRLEALYRDFDADRVLFTSSFGTTAGVLLHLIAEVNPRQRVHFIDTTYHFRETLWYKERVAEELGLEMIDLKPEPWKNEFTRKESTWASDPDLCCSINKVEPVERIKGDHDVWISGLLAYQNQNRKRMRVFTPGTDILRFHPILDMTRGEVEQYYRDHDLPRHPLEGEGYGSIGCVHCTFKGKGRRGRWPGKAKTECGLHVGK